MNKLTKAQLQSELRKEVAQANRMLKNLEEHKAQQFNAYRHASQQFSKTDKAYRVDKNGNVRFRGDLSKMTRNEQLHLLKEVKNFRSAKTSTPFGIKKQYSKAANTFNKRHKTNLTSDEFAKIWENSKVQQFKKIYGSDRIVKLTKKSLKGMDSDTMIKFMEDSLNEKDLTGADVDYMLRYKMRGGKNPFENQ